MLLTQLFTKTQRHVPADEKAKNAQLLIQAGFIHKEMAGVYAYLPLGLRVIENIKAVIREEMNALGGQELLMTSLQRQDLWEKTDRWDEKKVDVWFKSRLQSGADVGFAWSHEEQITDMLKNYVSSYRDLPVYVYQFQTKLRNELRAKSGIMRGREFIMKDLYSYSSSDEEHQKFYDGVSAAYLKIFDRLGLGKITFITYASGGAFTKFSHEFQTLTDAGEDTLFKVPSSGELYNEEIAPAKAPRVKQQAEMQPMKEVEGKDLIGVEPLAKFLGIAVEQTTKTMLFLTDSGKVVAAAVRGGYNINEEKLKDVVGAKSLTLADEETVKKVTGAEVGYAGILNLPEDVEIVIDESCEGRVNFEMGSNHTHFHSVNVNWGQDLPEPAKFHDIKVAKKGDAHPDTNEVYEVLKAAEVGNIFSFGGTKAQQLGLNFTDKDGQDKPVILGSYGIGVSRLMGVIAEHFADSKGLVWPENIAPARVYLVRLGDTAEAADKIYQQLSEAGISVLYDDRELRAGEKFADADLMGIPYRLVVSDKTVLTGKHELKKRTSADTQMLGVEALIKTLADD